MSSKIGFYLSLHLEYIGLLRHKFQAIPIDISNSLSAQPLSIHFWTPVNSAGANVIVHDVMPDLLASVQNKGLPWRISHGEHLPTNPVDYLVCFKAVPAQITTGKRIMLICDQAEVYWHELPKFDAIIATSSQPFAGLVARQNHHTAYIGESESTQYLNIGEHNLNTPPSQRGPLIMWHGGHYSMQSLLNLRPTLEEFSRRQPVELLVISGKETQRTEYWGDLTVHYYPWSRNTLFECSSKARLGIIPSRGTLRSGYLKPASRVRCLYALGVPAIGDSHVPDVLDFMDGFSGPVARNPREWMDKLNLLLNDQELDRLAIDGFHRVKDRYSTTITAQQWINYFLNFAP